MSRRLPRSTLFPYTTLFRSITDYTVLNRITPAGGAGSIQLNGSVLATLQGTSTKGGNIWFYRDRKSTRLNSSHPSISYAVFCLKKKKQTMPHYLRSS